MNKKKYSKIDKDLVRIEAILYAAGRPVEIEKLKGVLKTSSKKRVINLVNRLAKIYDARGGALFIEELPEDQVALRVREECSDVARAFASKPLLKPGPLKTLSYIAYYEPVRLSEVARGLGGRANSHVRVLEGMGLIKREEDDKGVILRTTKYFEDYFRFGAGRGDPKQQLRSLFESLRISKLENGGNIDPPMPEAVQGIMATLSAATAYPVKEVLGGQDGGHTP